MADVMINDIYLTAIADAIRLKLGTSSTYTPPNMAPAIRTISGGSVLQEKTVDPTTAQQLVVPDTGYDGLSSVTVNAVTAGTTGTPTATKGTVSNHSISITPRVTNTTGYITGGIKTGTAVTVTASELVSGTLSVTTNGTKDVTNYASIDVNISGDVPVFQDKTISPTESIQVVEPDSGYDALSSVTVNAISSTYVGSGITQRSSTDLSTSGATVTVPAGYYGSAASKSVSSGTAGTPTATKGTVSNHSVSITPSVTNTTGYITGSTKTGTAVTVSASELVSGNKAISANGTGIDVTNYATVSVAVGSDVNNQDKTITPTTSQQTITADEGYSGLGTVTVNAISPVKSSSDLTASGPTVTVPAGYYSSQATKSVTTMTLPTSASASATSGYTSKATISRSTSDQYINIAPGYNSDGGYYKISAVANGSATGPSNLSASGASITTGTNTITLTKTNVSTTPTVSAGYISSATASTATVALTASVTAVQGTKTWTPTTSDQTISANTFVTGVQTIKGDANLAAGNIKNGVSIFGVTGSYSGASINNQDKTVTPTETEQSITADTGYTGLGTVTISAISSDYVGSGINRRDVDEDVYQQGDTVYIPEGYYDHNSVYIIPGGVATAPASISGTSAAVSTGTNTLTLTKTVSVTPSVTAGFITIGTAGNSSVSLTASVTVNPTPTASGATVTIPAGYYSSQTTKSVSSLTLPTSTSSSATSGYTSKATITPSTSDQYLNIGTGYNSTNSYYKISAMSTMTLPTSAAASATSGYTSKATISRSTSDQYINIPTGYNSSGAYYKISAVANGSATGPSSLSGTSATVSTGTNTLTLTKTGVTTTPTVSAGYVSSATASTATVTLTASVTTKAAATITPGTTNQTIAAGTYLTGTQTIAGDANLIEENIKSGVSIFGKVGTYEGSSGSSLTVATSTSTLSSSSSSISFNGLLGEPTSFAVVSAADLATGSSPWKTAAVVFDGTDLHGQTIRNTSNAQVTYDNTDFSKSYSNGTLTITGSGTNFQANQYKLVYTYGGSDIGTADVQVGSGATSVTFTGLSEEPSYFSCIFKSNFSTSSGYQRVIVVVYDGTSTYGMEMDSSAKASTEHWSYSYSNGSLTISSSGTNAGGYFHQPGYYQLTYAVEGESGNYQSKTVYATSSQQVVQADSGYDALKKVTIPAVTTTNLSASNILSGVTIQVGDSADSDRIASVTGNVVIQSYYTGSSAPSSSLGNNGDLYLQV